MASLNDQNREMPPAQAPADAMPAPAVDVQQLNLDQVMAMVRQEVERRGPTNAADAPDAPADVAPSPVAPGLAAANVPSPAPSRKAIDGTGATAVPERPALTTDEIMRRVRAEVRRRRGEVDTPEANEAPPDDEGHGNTADGPSGLPPREPAISPLPLKPEYSVHELLQFSDAEFVDTIYRVILRRPADAAGRSRYLSALRNGLAGKTEVLGLIRFSQEGRQRGVHIDGLLLRFKLQRWRHLPVLGRCLAFATAVARLPRLSTRLQVVEGNAARSSQALERYVDLNSAAVNSRFGHVDRTIMPLHAQVARVEEALNATVARIDAVEQNFAVQRQQTDRLFDERGREQHEFADRLEGQQSTIEALRETLQGQQRKQRENDDGLAARLAQQETALAQLRAELGSVRDEARESVSAREKNEVDLNALRQNLVEQESAISDLSQRLRRSRTASEDRIKALMGRLDDQMLAVTDLAGDVGAFKEAGDKVRHDLAEKLAGTASEMANVQRALAGYVEQVHAFGESLRAQKDEAGNHHHEVVNHLDAHDALLKNLSVEGQRVHHGALEIQRQLIALLDRNMSPVPAASGEQPATGAGDKVLAPQYVSFEDAFRGEREDIKQRVAPYLDTLAAAGLGPDSGRVLDLGCGRGEWLEVLAENGYTCRGVDLNSAMVADSGASGFDVVEADAVIYLRDQQEASIAAITAMHIVEHIPHNTLIRLLDEAWRVLIPGGVLILETPNPENLTVGSCLFYLDPTHRNPIPPALLQWTVKERGFDEAVIERLTAHRGSPAIAHVPDDAQGAAQINQMIDWFTAAPDYAIVAKKPADESKSGNASTTDA